MMVGNARRIVLAAGIAAGILPAAPARAQVVAANPAQTAVTGPTVGDVAPEITLTGATRYGVLRTPVRLSDFRGRTVVLAFFFQARTKG